MSISVLMEKDTLTGERIRVTDQEANAHTLLSTDGVDIMMPLPTNIVSTASPQWQGSDRSLVQSLTEQAIEGQALETLKNWHGEMKGVVEKHLKSAVGATGVVAAGLLGREQILHKAGKALNPFKQMMFSGMDFRTFDLEFEIIPKSHKESNELTQAIKHIQINSVPEILDAAAGLFMEYPASWIVNFEPSANHLPSFLPSVITNINVDYSGAAGKIVFKENHAPVSVNLSLSFAETEIFTKENAKLFYG